jgi:hypothetical protein
MSNHVSNVRQGTSGIFSGGEQKLLVEVYEEYKHRYFFSTQNGNNVTINKNREAAWQRNCGSVELFQID